MNVASEQRHLRPNSDKPRRAAHSRRCSAKAHSFDSAPSHTEQRATIPGDFELHRRHGICPSGRSTSVAPPPEQCPNKQRHIVKARSGTARKRRGVCDDRQGRGRRGMASSHGGARRTAPAPFENRAHSEIADPHCDEERRPATQTGPPDTHGSGICLRTIAAAAHAYMARKEQPCVSGGSGSPERGRVSSARCRPIRTAHGNHRSGRA